MKKETQIIPMVSESKESSYKHFRVNQEENIEHSEVKAAAERNVVSKKKHGDLYFTGETEQDFTERTDFMNYSAMEEE